MSERPISDRMLDEIYASLQGQLIPDAHIPGVPNLFEPLGCCHLLYSNMLDAYQRAEEKMFIRTFFEDPDLEEMVDSLLAIQERLAKEMFLLGIKYQTQALLGPDIEHLYPYPAPPYTP